MLPLALGASLLLSALNFPAHAAQAPVLAPLWVQTIDDGADCPADYTAQAHHAPAAGQVQHDADGNIYVVAKGVLRSFDKDGAPRWSTPPCPSCTAPDDIGGFAVFSVMPGGEVWALEARQIGTTAWHTRFEALHRIDAGGTIVQTHPLASTAFTGSTATVLRTTTRGAVLMTIAGNALHMLQARTGLAHTSVIPLTPNHDGMVLLTATVVDGDDLLVALLSGDDEFCFPGVPSCGIDQTGLLRVGTNGALVWRRDMDAASDEVAFGPDGSAYLIDAMGALVRVAPNGNIASIGPQPQMSSVYGIVGPLDGHLLIGSDELLSVDLTGHIRARVDAEEDPYRYPWHPRLARASSAGFVVPLYMDPQCHSAAIYRPSTLVERYRLYLEGTTCATEPDEFGDVPPSINQVGVTGDGGVTLLRYECGEDSEPTRIARYGLPGTPAGGLLLRDGFEPPAP